MVFSSILSLFVSRRGRRVSTRSITPRDESRDAASAPLRVVVVEDADPACDAREARRLSHDHAIDATRLHQTRPWVVSGLILSRSGPRRAPLLSRRLSDGRIDGVEAPRHRSDAIAATTSQVQVHSRR